MSYGRDKTDGAGAIAAASRPARSAPGVVVRPSQVRDYRAMGMISTTALGPKYVGDRTIGGGGGNTPPPRPPKATGPTRVIGTFQSAATQPTIIVQPNQGFPPKGPRPTRPASPGRPSNGKFGFLPPSTGGKGDGKLPPSVDPATTGGSGGTFVTATPSVTTSGGGGSAISDPIRETDDPTVLPEDPIDATAPTAPAPTAPAPKKSKLLLVVGAVGIAYLLFSHKRGR